MEASNESMIKGLTKEQAEILLNAATLSAFIIVKGNDQSEDMEDRVQFLYSTLIVYFMQGFNKDFGNLESILRSAMDTLKINEQFLVQ